MIVKVQWPMFPPDADIFIYSKPGADQRHWMVPQEKFEPKLLDRLKADCTDTGKAYYEATFAGLARPNIGKRVEDQRW